MTLSAITVTVLVANGVTAVVAAMLLMVVLWQAPRQRANALFALTMLTLGAYSVANGFGRFIDDLQLDPAQATYLAITLYAMFVALMFFFASEYADTRTPLTRVMRWGGVVLALVTSVALWSGLLLRDIRPVTGDNGGYRGDWSAWGLLAGGMMIAYLLATAIILYRMRDDRARALWPAPLLIVAANLSALFIWPNVPLPLNAVLLAGAALALGLPVLRYQLFHPLANLHAELARKNHDLQEASRLKSQFLTNMSHELRTPLNSIIGYTELVISGTYGALNDTQRDRLEKVVRNGHNLLGLINDVLDLNRIESGRVMLERHRLETPELLESVLSTVEPLAQQKGLALVREFTNAPPILADETRAQQVITNILANAVKFTSEGRIVVRAFRVGEMVQFEIEDTGIGIRRDQHDAVFAEFRQLDDSSTRRFEGSGLGLTITRRLVEMHGGRIWLESEEGVGTTFYVTLPAATPRITQTAPAVTLPAPVSESA